MMDRIKRRCGIVLSFCFMACSSGAPLPRVERVDSLGVEIVTNATVEDRVLPWDLSELWRAGGVADEEFQLQELYPWQVAIHRASSTIYVLDAGASRIRILRADGSAAGSWARPGSGPGELASPLAIAADSGIVAVYDYERGGVELWSHSGESRGTTRLETPFWGPRLASAGGSFLFTALAGPASPTDEQQLVSHDGAGVETITRLSRMADVVADFPTCGIHGLPVSTLFAPELVWDAEGETIVTSTLPEYEIHVHEEGALARIIRRSVEPVRVTDRIAVLEAGSGLEITVASCTVPPEEVARGRGYAPVIPAIRALSIAPNGDLWVERGSPADITPPLDVYDRTGEYLGTMPSGSPFPVAFLDSMRIVSVTTDSLGVPMLIVSRLMRGGS